MRQTLTTRFAGLVLAFAFLASSAGDAFGLHECPHHDALPAGAAPDARPRATPSAAGESHHHGATRVDGTGSSAAPAQGEATGHAHDSSLCTCLGHCDTTSGQAHPSLGRVESAPGDAFIFAAATSAAAVAPVRHTPYLLPWSTAPPSVR